MNRFWRKFPPQYLFFFFVCLVFMAKNSNAIAAQLITSWTDASSNEDGFTVERKNGTTGTFSQIVTVGVNVASYTDTGITGGATYCYRVRAFNTAGNSAYSNEACGTAMADSQAPTVSMTTPTNGITVSGSTVTVSANAADNVGVVGVQFLLDGNNLGNEDTISPYSLSWNTTTVTNGTHTLAARARDAAGNQTTSTTVTVTVSNTAPPPNLTGLITAYGFNEGNGSTTVDASGNNNVGTLVNGATWAGGKNGNAVSFDGTNDNVALPNTLDIASLPFTLEAWIRPTSFATWQAIFSKRVSYSASQMRFDVGLEISSGKVYVTTDNSFVTSTYAPPLNTWTHVALVAESTGTELYVNGSLQQTLGAVTLGSGATAPVAIGTTGDNEDPFKGQIDDLRLYIRALSQTEIQTDMNTAVGSTPAPTTYSLTVTKAGTGSGTVSATGISCGSDCTESYVSGTLVALIATPAAGSTFASWSGAADCSDGSVTMSAATTCTATFTLVPPTTYSLTVTKAGSGSGTVSGTGISCGADCSESYTSGTIVALTATPASGSTFTGWSGDSDCSDGSVTMNAAKTCTATFTLVPPTTYSLAVTKAGSGSGTVSGTGISCGADCSESYTSGTIVALTATPASGSTFAGWNSNCTGTGTCSVTMSAAKSVTATFTRPLQVQIGIFRPSTATWYFDLNGNGVFDGCTIDTCPATFGISTDRPTVGNWTGIGTSQLGTFDPTTRMWELDRNGNDRWEDCTIDLCRGPFGQSTDLPVAGYWKAGMTAAGIGTFRPSTGKWYLDLNGNGKLDKGTIDARLGPFGTATDKPVVGNWNGTGVTRIGVFTPANGQWKLDINGNGTFDGCTTDSCRGPFGTTGDLPVSGDWTGTGRTKVGVFTPANGQWKLDINGNGIFDGCTVDACLGAFGQQGDLPVVGEW